MVIATPEDTFWRLTSDDEQPKRHRLGFGNLGEEFKKQFCAIMRGAEQDERFAFALSTYWDAVHESNPHFKAARYFNCLETLAYRLKGGSVGSREAVRRLFRPNISFMLQTKFEGQMLELDVVEICGRIRDRLFHGTPFVETHLKTEIRPYFRVIRDNPLQLVGQIEAFCELHLALWANGVSPGQAGGGA